MKFTIFIVVFFTGLSCLSQSVSDTSSYEIIKGSPDKQRSGAGVGVPIGASFSTCNISPQKIYLSLRREDDHAWKLSVSQTKNAAGDGETTDNCRLHSIISDDTQYISGTPASPAVSTQLAFVTAADTVNVHFIMGSNSARNACSCEFKNIRLPVTHNARFEATLYPDQDVIYYTFLDDETRDLMMNDPNAIYVAPHKINLQTYYLDTDSGVIQKGARWWKPKQIEKLTERSLVPIDTLESHTFPKSGKTYSGKELIMMKKVGKADLGHN